MSRLAVHQITLRVDDPGLLFLVGGGGLGNSSLLHAMASDTLNYLLIEGEAHKLVLCKVNSSKGADSFDSGQARN